MSAFILQRRRHSRIYTPNGQFRMNYAHPLARNVIGLYLLNGPFGGTLRDLSPQRRDATVNGTPAREAVPGGLASAFDGSTDYYQVSTGHELTDMSIELIVTLGSDIVQKHIAGMAESPGSATNDRHFYIDASNKFVWRTFNGAANTSTTSAVTGRTTHLLGTALANTDHSLFVDGVKEANTVAGPMYTGYATPEWIMGYGWNGGSSTDYFDGHISLCVLYDRLLTDKEAFERYVDPYSIIQSMPVTHPFNIVTAAATVSDKALSQSILSDILINPLQDILG